MSESTMVLTVRTVTLTILIYAVLLVALGLLAGKVLNWSEYHHLALVGVKTVGQVNSKEESNHNAIRYSFKVNGLFYHGIGSAGGENPTFIQLQPGSEVIVYYDPDNPDLSSLGNPKEHAASRTNGVIFTSFFGSLFSMVSMYRKKWLPIFTQS